MQLSQSCKHSESTDLLRKSLLPHVFTVSKFSHLILRAGTMPVLGNLCIQYSANIQVAVLADRKNMRK